MSLKKQAQEICAELKAADAEIDDRELNLVQQRGELQELRADRNTSVDQLAAKTTKLETSIATSAKAIEILKSRRQDIANRANRILNKLREDHHRQVAAAMNKGILAASDFVNSDELSKAVATILCAYRYQRDALRNDDAFEDFGLQIFVNSQVKAVDERLISERYNKLPSLALPTEPELIDELEAAA